MSCAGNADLSTPAMDQLASQGVRFDKAYVANPICVASRTSYMTGTPSHVNGVVTNMHANQVPVNQPCLAKVFQDAGYATGHVGKWHVPRAMEDRAWSGFDHIGAARNNRVDFDIPAAAETFLRQERDKPFFLMTEFVNPHDICELARRLSGDNNQLPNGEIPPIPPADQCPPVRFNQAIPAGEPPVIREHQNSPQMRPAYPTSRWPDDDPRWRQYLWGYYRMVEMVDRQIAQVLESLRETGQADNTVILFTSDHGDGMGAHHWNQKTLFYDEVSRVPFIVSWPGCSRSGAVDRDALINVGTDLFPTLFDLAGIQAPAHLHGRSAVASKPHDYIVSQTNHHQGFGQPGDVHGRMVRSARYKYICYTHGERREQLFDLDTDPGELHDLFFHGGADDVLAAHRAMLDEYIRNTGDGFTVVA